MEYPHWQYFLSLVEDVERLSRYVSLTEDNFGTSSIECTRILLAASSEADVVCKVLCEQISPRDSAKNIEEYGKILLQKWPNFKTTLVSVRSYTLSLKPWGEWTFTRRPNWWQDHNRVKHERHKHADLGNLGNALNSVAGLCVLVSYLHYNDFISQGLATRRPFLFLDDLYNGSGPRLRSSTIILPDLEAPEQS